MAADASVKRTDEIRVFSSYLQSFCDSFDKNGTALTNLMVQKIEPLKKAQKQAEEIVKQLEKRALEAENALAAHPMGEEYPIYYRAFHELHEKVVTGHRLLGDMKSKINIAQHSIRCIVEDTKKMQTETKQIISDGRTFLGNAYNQLKQYQEQR